MRSKYSVILQSLPSDYEKTLDIVQDDLTDDQICDVLTSADYATANKIILNCLIEKVKYAADIVGLCDQLEKIIANPGTLAEIIREFKASKKVLNLSCDRLSLQKQGMCIQSKSCYLTLNI